MGRTYNLNPIVVTGSGHHQRLKSTSTPVRVLSSQEISEQGITTFDGVLTRMMPQASMAPNSMGTFLRLNGLGNKYILILVNGQKLSGDISNNVDLNRINMSRVKRIEVLDGAASSLYGSDAIAGVINIITDQPTQQLISVMSDTRVSGHGQLTESVNLDIYKNGFGSYTSFTHDRANSYQTTDLEYVKGSEGETQRTIAPLFTGYRSNIVGQKFTYALDQHLALNAGFNYSYKITDRPNTHPDIKGGTDYEMFNYSYKITDRPNTHPDIKGGTDYEMRYKGFRWNVGGIYKFTNRNSLQADFTVDRFRYGKEYDVETKTNAIGDYVQSKKQRMMEGHHLWRRLAQRLSDGHFWQYRSECLYTCRLCPARDETGEGPDGYLRFATDASRDFQRSSDAKSHTDVCTRQFPLPCHLFGWFPCART